jgi:PAS domain S-box-containing protein
VTETARQSDTPIGTCAGRSKSEDIAALVATLFEADRQLDELMDGRVDSVSDAHGGTMLLRRAQRQLREGDGAMQSAVLDAIPINIAVLDARGGIIWVNAGWKQFAAENAMQAQGQGIGANYLEICDRARGDDSAQARAAAAGIRGVLGGEVSSYSLDYPCHSPTQRRWFRMRVATLVQGDVRGAVVMHLDITARVEAAQDLATLSLHTERRERMLNTMLSSISDFTYLFDRQGRFLYANQPLLDLWGVTLDQVVGTNYSQLSYPDELAARLQGQVQEVFTSKSRITDETSYVSPSGQRGDYECIFSPAIGPDGSVDFVVGSTRDVTQRKQSEIALRASEAQFRTLAESMPQMVWLTRSDGWNIYVNQNWMDYTGLSLEQSLGHGWIEAVHPDDRQRSWDAWQHATATQGEYSLECLLRRADGAYRWWLTRAVPQWDETGKILKWIGTSTDIHDLKLAQLEISQAHWDLQRQQAELRKVTDLLEASHAQLVTAQSVAKMGNWSTDLVSGKGEWSLGTHSVFGTDVELFEPTYEGFLNLVHPDDRAAVDQAFLRPAGLQSAQVFEFRIVLPTGAVKVVEERWQVFRDPRGVPVRAFGTSQDVTERRRNQDALREINVDLELRVNARTAELTLAREEAEHANQAKSDFLAAISHELRTPMSGLLGLLELLGLDQLKKEQHETLAVARESGNALLHIIDDLLDFSKIEADRLELDPEAASVAEVVERTCLLHSQIASSKDLTLAFEVDPQISPLLSFDALRLGQILNNFLNNAVKFTERGRVDVRVDLAGRAPGSEELRFTVRDTGIGITPEQLGRLFQPFVQAGRGTSTRFGGTGLGLVISRRLAHLMGGAVEIQSEPGRGTTLTLTVAFAVCAEEPVAGDTDRQVLDALLAGRRPAPALLQAERDGTLLLVVDDHPTNRLLLLRQVASLGYAAEAADDGEQALAAWKSGRFAAIITDCNMPRMNGYELTAAIRSAEEQTGARRIPIIGCTANATREAAEQCLSAGMDDWLIKPAGLVEMSQKLDLWVPLARFERMATVPAPLLLKKQNGHAPAPVEPGLIDLALLGEISGGNPQIQQEILADFHRMNEQDAVSLRQAVVENDFKRVMQFAHRIKGANLMLGAARLAAACERLESAGAAGQSGALQAAMTLFEAELLRLERSFGKRSAAP